MPRLSPGQSSPALWRDNRWHTGAAPPGSADFSWTSLFSWLNQDAEASVGFVWSVVRRGRLAMQASPAWCLGMRGARLPDRSVHRAALATVGFGTEDHVVEGAELEAEVSPGVEVIARGYGMIGTDGGAAPLIEILVEGGRALDGGLVYLGVLVGFIDMAIAGHAALLRARNDGAELADVVLDERICGPAVDGDVVVAAGLPHVVVDGAGTAGVPSLAAHHVVHAGPRDRIVAGILRGKRHGCRPAAGVERVVVPVIRAGSVVLDRRLGVCRHRCAACGCQGREDCSENS